MKPLFTLLCGFLSAFLLSITPAFAQEVDPLTQPPFNTLTWETGPKSVAIGPKATFKVPKDFVYLSKEDTALFMKMVGNMPQNNFYLIAPRNFTWLSFFHFVETGYVKDDKKIDTNKLVEMNLVKI